MKTPSGDSKKDTAPGMILSQGYVRVHHNTSPVHSVFFPYLHTIPPHLPNKIHALGIEEEDPQYLEDEDQMSPLQHPLPTTTPNDTTTSRIPSLLTHPRLVPTSTPNSYTTPQQHQIPTKCVFDFNHILILIFPNLQVPST